MKLEAEDGEGVSANSMNLRGTGFRKRREKKRKSIFLRLTRENLSSILKNI